MKLVQPFSALELRAKHFVYMRFFFECGWFCERNGETFVLVAEIPCEWIFATKSAVAKHSRSKRGQTQKERK